MVQTRSVDRQKRAKLMPKKGKSDNQAKTPNSSSSQGQPANGPAVSYPDWSSYQAYYNAGGTNPMTSAAPQGHPYMWGPQMPPYGTPPPYVAMYPPGGIYHYPPGSVPYSPYPTQPPNGNAETSEKSNKNKESTSSKGSKGRKRTASSSNDGSSQSGESESEDSSEGSSSSSKNGLSSGKETTAQKQTPPQQRVMAGPTVPFWHVPAGGFTGPAGGAGPEYWGASTPMSIQVKPPSAPRRTRDTAPADPTDERELKRQRRKQSNRESARRSRLKKQAEWEEVARRTTILKEENDSLKEELHRLKEECDRLTSENSSLKVSPVTVPYQWYVPVLSLVPVVYYLGRLLYW